MKKLTAGIFSVLMGLVAVNAADAAVASKGYVTGQINAVNEEIAKKVSQEAYDAYTEANDIAVASKVAQTDYDAKVQALETKDTELAADIAKREVLSVSGAGLKLTEGVLTLDGIATSEGLSNLTTTVEGHTTALGILNGGAEVTGSVAQQIAAATTAITTAYEAADTGLQNQIDALDGTYATDTELANEKAALQQRITENANNFANYTTTTDMNAALALKEDVANKLTGETVSSTDLTATKYMSALTTDKYIDKKLGVFSEGNAAELAGMKDDIAANTENIGGMTYDPNTQKITEFSATTYLKDSESLSDAVVALDTAAAAAQGTANANAQAIEAINNETTGILATAKADTASQISALDLQAISRVPAECSEPTKYCALTTNGTNFVWEVIERDPSEFEADGITLKSEGRTVVEGVTE